MLYQIPQKTILLYQGPENSSIPALREDGLLRNDTHSKSNILNRQFHKEFTPVTDTPLPNKGPSPHPQMNNISIHVNGVENPLKNINPHKAKGPDVINCRVLKECRTNIAPILAIIFEKSLTSGSIPSDWEHANVCPVYKKGDKQVMINPRTIDQYPRPAYVVNSVNTLSLAASCNILKIQIFCMT